MRFSSKERGNRMGSRLRKKRKRLDAICEKEYSRNRGDLNEGSGGAGRNVTDDTELRRSSRVRRAPVLLDVSPQPKRRRIHKNVALSVKKSSARVKENTQDSETPGIWGSRLRARSGNLRFGVEEERGLVRGKRKLFKEKRAKDEENVVEVEMDGDKGDMEGGNSRVVKAGRHGKMKSINFSWDREKEKELFGIKEDNESEENMESKSKESLEDEIEKEELEDMGSESEEGVEDETEKEDTLGDTESESEESIQDENEREEMKVMGNNGEGMENENEGEEMVVMENSGEDGIEDEDEREEIVLMGNNGKEVTDDEIEREEMVISESKGEGSALIWSSQMVVGNEREILDGKLPRDIDKGDKEISDGLHPERTGIDNDNVEAVDIEDLLEHREKEQEEVEYAKEDVNQTYDEVPGEVTTMKEANGGTCDRKDVDVPKLDKNSLEHENGLNMSSRLHSKQCIIEGRRCGLCGGGTDGKPPKVVQDMGESENETWCDDSVPEEPNYDIWDGFGEEPGWLGRLLGPINDRYGIAGIWVHQHCAVWSPEVYFAGLGCLKNVRAALCRGRALKCTRCGRPGATIGCRVDRCPRTYHLPCARAYGCIFDHRKFLIACTDHRHIFQPHGNQYLAQIKKMKAKKMKMEVRKVSNDAWRRDIEAEEKWLENCGEDEEFLKRESKRLHRDLQRIAPVYIGGSGSEGENLFQGWESVAGLQDVIQCMKEVVILPLLYPEFFDNLGITPPRGVLLHGYPGTGKTHVVRALIGACARGDKRIAYFARKGADCLGKYVGDAERQLRLLFQVAEKCQPSIIFFDEIDGLAPQRTRQQDQTHSSVVSTLLALLDGLKSRGSVVVIGATNRPDAVDPALRRPGRFDREIYFPLPSMADRAAILSLHTQKWPKPVGGLLLEWIARKTAGFAGADLQALCTQAAIISLKRNFPLHDVLSSAGENGFLGKRPTLPAFAVEERDWLEAISCAPPPCSRREAGMAANSVVSSPLPSHLLPCLIKPLSTLLVSLYTDERIWLPTTLSNAAITIKSVIVSALDKKKMATNHWWSYVDNFIQEAEIAKEIGGKLWSTGLLLGDTSTSDLDAFNRDIENSEEFKSSIKRNGESGTCSIEHLSFASKNKSGFRILIAGDPRSGQRHLSSCLLHCFVGNIEVLKVDLASISQDGHGDVVQGITQILMKCASVRSCIVFMPRIDLWAVETCRQVTEEEGDTFSTDEESPEKEESFVRPSQFSEKKDENSSEETEFCASHAWCSFVEQVGYLCVSASLMILATSEVPFPLLPERIRQFFRNDVSICSQTTLSEHTVPRFSVQIDGNFNRDVVINLSAAELSRDIVQLLAQFIHQKSHINTTLTSNNYRADCPEGNTEKVLGNGQEDVIKPLNKPSSPPNKGKSTLHLAISTFGYQILRYPHFAELCWVTSKLKEGPSADISGPWKGWPFNSCITHPMNSLQKVSFNNGVNNVKAKEKSGIVRGLVAVGLSAYQGVYTSLREVSSEVRKVLELLVGQVNLKVNAGKDGYQYVRLLSQVAYLEDMVNNWAYTLQSLEQGAPRIVLNPDKEHACDDNGVQSKENNPDVLPDSSHLLETDEGCLKACIDEKVESVDLSEVNGGHLGHYSSAPDASTHHDSAPANDQSFDNVSVERNETIFSPYEVGNLQRQVNGIGPRDSVLISENGLGSGDKLSGDLNFSMKNNGSCSTESGTRFDDSSEPQTGDQNVDHTCSSSKNDVSTSSEGIVCSFYCCSDCLSILHGWTKKILSYEFGSNRTDLTADDVHDVVATLSLDLLAAVRKVLVTGDTRNLLDQNLRQGNSDSRACQCKYSTSMDFKPGECSCHEQTKSTLSAEANTSLFISKFIFRDGVLVSVEPEKGVPLHCRFERLCLCSLIELLGLTKWHTFPI